MSNYFDLLLSYLANRETDRQTDKREQTHLFPPLSEVNDRQTDKQTDRTQLSHKIRLGVGGITFLQRHQVAPSDRDDGSGQFSVKRLAQIETF